MLKAVKPHEIGRYLSKVRRTFPTLEPNQPLSERDVRRYYEESAPGYSFFHSAAGAIHMAISNDGRFRKNDYFRQGEMVVSIARIFGPTGSILEAGCGRGFNLAFIANELPGWQCTGIDITVPHVRWAKDHFSDLPNVSFELTDFHNMGEANLPSQNVIFFVESICHAIDVARVLRAVHKTLAPNGRLIIFDGFRSSESELSPEWAEAAALVEAAMAVPQFPEIHEFLAIAKECGLAVESNIDLSSAIMPNLIRLSDFAKSFFKIPVLTRAFVRLLPRGLVCNAVAGLLMPLTVSTGIHQYRKLVFTKL